MPLPLKGKRIVLTRSAKQAGDDTARLKEFGADVILFPTIKIVEVEDYSRFDYLVRSVEFDYIIFTSVNAASKTLEHIFLSDAEFDFERTKLSVTGSKTKEYCRRHGVEASVLPEDFSAKGLLEYFEKAGVKGKNIFLPGSSIARPELRDGLKELGAHVYYVPVYDVVKPSPRTLAAPLAKIKSRKPDVFIFTSPSSFGNFLELADVKEPESYFSGAVVAAIGPTTAEAIKNTGTEVTLVPDTYTMDNLIEVLVNFFTESDRRQEIE